LAVSDEPFCLGACGGFTNARYAETGDLRDQWLCRVHMKPARAIFMSTERWAIERDLYEMRKR
jgi:hypothetical protein